MKKMRLLAWLLSIAMLTMTFAAMAEETEIELAAGAADALPVEIQAEAGEDVLELDGLDIELPDLALDDGPSGEPDGAAEGDAQAEGVVSHIERLQLDADAADNDRLFAGYVDLLFGKRPEGDLRSNGFIGDTLTGMAREVYDFLSKKVRKVAAGTESSTLFWIPTSIADAGDVEAFKEACIYGIYAMLFDFPYDLYWYDKTGFCYMATNRDGELCVLLPVVTEYADWRGVTYEGYPFATDSARLRTAQVAAANARKVVKKYAGVSDYKKLCGYRDYICANVNYNDYAAEDAKRPYGNPWQLIWAFDGDPSTDIVCEGYSKAFQYLCDLSSFKSFIECHIVTGTAYSGGSSGPHMWNIVTMDDGKNYHVDITFVDGGYTAAFLCGAEKAKKKNAYMVRNELTYQLDSDVVSIYPAKTLKLSTSDYEPGKTVLPKSVELKKGKTTLKKGEKISVARGKSVTLKAVVYPDKAARTKLTWTSSNKYVTVQDGKVTVNEKAKVGTKAKITVKTSNKKTTYIYVVVK